MGKKKLKKKFKSKYSPLKGAIGIDSTIVAAALLLDQASIKAAHYGDPHAMGLLAGKWIDLGNLMNDALGGGSDDHDHEEHDVSEGVSVMGFGNTETREKAEAVNREQRRTKS